MLTMSTYEADIGTIVLNNASKRNALDEALVGEVVAALDGFRKCKARVVVLRAPAGSKVWSAGRDVAELPQGRSAGAIPCVFSSAPSKSSRRPSSR